jgi:hypothetical protein
MANFTHVHHGHRLCPDEGHPVLCFHRNVWICQERFVGWAEPARIRWALAQQYPWLEQAQGWRQASLLPKARASIVEESLRSQNE